MSKRKKAGKRTEPVPPVVVLGDRRTELVYEADPEDRPVVHHRVVDSLGRMLRAGTIDQGMHDAARDFEAAFALAALETMRAMPLVRMPGSSRPDGDLNDRQIQARKRIHKAIEAVGGLSSPGGSAVWFVVGLGHSVREWALRQGWGGGRSMSPDEARGALVTALAVLAKDGGYRSGRLGPEFCA